MAGTAVYACFQLVIYRCNILIFPLFFTFFPLRLYSLYNQEQEKKKDKKEKSAPKEP